MVDPKFLGDNLTALTVFLIQISVRSRTLRFHKSAALHSWSRDFGLGDEPYWIVGFTGPWHP